MRAFHFVFESGLLKGLRRFSTFMRDSQDLVECHNAMINEDGLIPHEVVTSLNADSISWNGEGSLVDTGVYLTDHLGNYITDHDGNKIDFS